MQFPQCFLVCELGPAIDKHAYEKSFRGQLYFPMFFFFFFFFIFNQKYIIQISVGGSGFERIEKY